MFPLKFSYIVLSLKKFEEFSVIRKMRTSVWMRVWKQNELFQPHPTHTCPHLHSALEYGGSKNYPERRFRFGSDLSLRGKNKEKSGSGSVSFPRNFEESVSAPWSWFHFFWNRRTLLRTRTSHPRAHLSGSRILPIDIWMFEIICPYH
jgi:hypothetical protein